MLGLTLVGGCAGDSKPSYCQMGIVERGIYGQPDPLLGIFVSWIMELGCIDFVFRPFEFTCSNLQYPNLIFAEQRIELGDFSIVSPAGGEWCVDRTYASQISYFSHPWLGGIVQEEPNRNQFLNTLAMVAMPVKVPEEYVDRSQDLRGFVERWIKSGFGRKGQGADAVVDMRKDRRFKLLDSTVSIDSNTDMECVRYEYEMEERGNPLAPDEVLIIRDVGRICRQSEEADVLIVASLSERYVRGYQIDPQFFATVKGDHATTFLDSIEFREPSP